MPHIHELIDFCAEVFVVYNNKVLLRIHDKYKIWLSVGGHIELHEDPNQAAIREVKEEVGLDVELWHHTPLHDPGNESYRPLIPPYHMGIHKIPGHPTCDDHQHLVMVYFARAQHDQIYISEDEQCDGCKWFTREELDDPQYNLQRDIRLYAKTALEKLVD